MKKAIFVRSLFALALIACCPLQTRANTIALGFSGGTSLTFGADVTVGLAFTLSSPVLVTDLGLWDFNNDGLSTSHVVTVWTSTGTQEAQVTIPSGSGATLINGFRYVSIVPVLVPAGSYTIGGFYSSASDPVAIQGIVIAASGLTYMAPGADLDSPFRRVTFLAGRSNTLVQTSSLPRHLLRTQVRRGRCCCSAWRPPSD